MYHIPASVHWKQLPSCYEFIKLNNLERTHSVWLADNTDRLLIEIWHEGVLEEYLFKNTDHEMYLKVAPKDLFYYD